MPQQVVQEAYGEAIRGYQAAVEGFFGPVSPTQGPVADPVTLAGPVEEAGRNLVARAEQELAAGEPGRCELVRFQMLAGAVADLAVAQEIAAVEGLAAGTGSRGIPTDVPPETRRIAEAILAARPEHGASGLGRPPAVGAAWPDDVAKARVALRRTAAEAVRLIVETTSQAAFVAYGGLVDLPAAPVEEAALVLAGDVPLRVGEGPSVLLHKAAALVLRGVEKIITAPGPGARQNLGRQVEGGIGKLRRGVMPVNLLGRVYDLAGVEQRIVGRVEGAEPARGLERWPEAAREATALAGRAARQNDLVGWLGRGLAWARPVLWSQPPWGPVLLTSAYVGLLGYAVVSGGEYLGWEGSAGGGRVEDLGTLLGRTLA